MQCAFSSSSAVRNSKCSQGDPRVIRAGVQRNAVTTPLLLCSTIYHLLRCVSRDWDDFLLRIDIVGIVVMVMGSFIVSLNTGFRCRPELAAMYLIIEAVPLLVASGLLLQSSLQSLFMVRVRNSLLVGAVAFGVIPVAHVLVECRFECSDHVIPAALGMFGPYFIGAFESVRFSRARRR